MAFECSYNPNDLIEQIGDPCFWICDNEFKHFDHPDTVRISDAELNQYIDITADNAEESMRMAEALIKLLNQDYENVSRQSH